MRRIALALVVTALAFVPRASDAAIINLISTLDGVQETPPVLTPATGTATLTFDTVSNLLSWTISYSGLVGTSTDAHFHGPAAIGVGPVGVQVAIPHLNGVTADTLIGSATLTATQETQILAHLWYINIHSTFKPGGEIRGQVVPEPATLALYTVGLVGLAFAGRRRSR